MLARKMNEGDRLRHAVVCAPGPAYSAVTDLEAHNLAEAPDAARSAVQHAALVRVMEEAGARVTILDEPDDEPNAVFVRDAALVTSAGRVRVRMGLPARRREPAWLGAALATMDLPPAGLIEAPGTLEGGDLILAGDVAFVGRSSRTNQEGIRQLTALLRPLGCEVRVAEVRGGHLHLGGVMSAIGPRRVVAVAGAVDPLILQGFEVVELPQRPGAPPGANVLCLGPDEVVANVSDGLDPVEVLEAHGVRVHRLDLSEFRKGSGGPTCLVLPVERG
ncbi:MAG TPA: arginine deiminase family protein [Longimicrobiales bacterium]|nr:arginine deiminase family protein [Longimicrobiales bacterium]